LIERLRLYSSKNPLISITPSAALPDRCDFDAVLLPASLLLSPAFPRTETIHRLRAAGCSLICFGAVELLAGCFLARCDEYLKEPWPPEELEWRLRKLRRDTEALFRFSWGSFEIGGLEIRSGLGSFRLCAQEQGILRLLAANAGVPVSREALYYGIWGRSAAGQSRAVDMHIASLRKKLRALFPESGDCIRSVWGVGYLIVN
jgi:DNA-binding response OmpR family regulator